MGHQLGVTLVLTTRQSTCGTGTIQECPRPKSHLGVITPQAPTTTTTTTPLLTITPIMGHLHLYRTTLQTLKTKGPLGDPWILWSTTRLGHPTPVVPCWLKVGESFPAPTLNQRAHGGNLRPLQSAWTTGHLLGENLPATVEAGEITTLTATAGETQR